MLRPSMRTAFVAAATLALTSCAPAGDQVQYLPGAGPLPNPIYSGYLKVSATKSLHYMYVESATAPTTDPVLIWLNGGPGCSSMLGAFSENGPFIFDDGEDVLKPNEYSWNARANVLYIESPAHVGYSIGGDNDWNFTDISQSIDLFAAVQQFYVLFPERLPNPLWISGESYAGIYGTFLAWQTHLWNRLGDMDATLVKYNLQGFALGNGITDWNVDAEPATWQTFREMNLIPPSLYDQFAANGCKYNVAKPYDNSDKCAPLEMQVDLLIAGLNPYDLFRTTYGNPSTLSKKLKAERKLESAFGEAVVGGEIKRFQRGVRQDQYTPWVKHNPLLAKQAAAITFADPMTAYLNREDVRAALHIPIALPGWNGCQPEDSLFTYPYSYEASIWIYRILQKYGYKMMHYSGDTDGVVPTIGTRRWVESLQWQVTAPWQPWTTDGQISGYTEVRGNFTLTTIHGVGHMAPQWKRKDVQSMILKYVHGESFLKN